jgi:hypothetical protein
MDVVVSIVLEGKKGVVTLERGSTVVMVLGAWVGFWVNPEGD